ncbi:hypothetical protein BH11MYX1_BH11MYX1_35660 [soil metagenome]
MSTASTSHGTHAAAAHKELEFKNTHHVAFDEIRALVHQQGKHLDPARVAELMVEHRSDDAAIAHFIQQHLGNHYMAEVTKALPHAAEANKRSVGMNSLNRHHRGTGTDGADPNRLAVHAGQHLHEATFSKNTLLYSNDGKPLEGMAYKDKPAKLNSGGSKKLVLEGLNGGTPVECVLGFRLTEHVAKTPTAAAHMDVVSGWIPLDALDGVGHKLAIEDKRIASGVAKVHHGLSYAPHAHKVHVKHAPADIAGLRLGKSSAASHDTANLPDHYYARGTTVNLLSNVPNSGPEATKKFGVAIDALVAGTEFTQVEPAMVEHVQLWEAKSSVLTDKVMTFVYGKAEAPGQAPSYGWINKDCLG